MSPRSHNLSGVEPEAIHAHVTERARRSRKTAPFNSERGVEILFSRIILALEPARVART